MFYVFVLKKNGTDFQGLKAIHFLLRVPGFRTGDGIFNTHLLQYLLLKNTEAEVVRHGLLQFT